MRGRIPLSVASVLCVASTAAAQTDGQVPLDVETVISGGYWQVDDSAHGSFRVIIETGGFEHLISEARVEWVAEPTESDTPSRLLATAPLTETTGGGVHLVNPVLVREDKRWILTIEAVNTHCDPVGIDRWRVALGAPGSLTVLGSTPVQAGCD